MPRNRKQIIRLTWKRFRGAILLLAKSRQGPRALFSVCALLALMLVINALNVFNSYVGRDFMSAIENRNLGTFLHLAIVYSGVFIASTVALVFYRYSEERLGILWREQLTWHLTESYLKDRTYYRLDSATGVANPDQRISEDVRAFTTTTLSFLLLILNGTITAVSFSGVLWTISPFLFAVAVVYAICGSALTVVFGKSLIRLNYHQLDMEANFRADLIHVRENSESIALSHREGRFKTRLAKQLGELTANFRRLIRVNRNLGFFTNGYNYFIQIIPAFIIAPKFIYGEIEFGVVTQSTMAFATLLGAFSLIVTQFQSISAFGAVTARLHRLSDAIEKAQSTRHCAMIAGECADRVSYGNVTLQSGDKSHVLLKDLTLEIQRGSRWLVTASEDAPKLALFRATAGLWDCGAGSITRPGLDDILFLQERPYLPPGSLREVLVRTGMEGNTTDAEILSILDQLGLRETVSRVGGLGAELDWDDELSIGEQHLLSIARIFLARPAFVFLDRPGSSLPKSKIAGVVEMFATANVGVVIFSKNGEARLHYDHCLEIGPDGTWEVIHSTGPATGDDIEELRDLSC
jgi:putative ATP-binding cassette transporter